ncbi:MAG TPA: triose-phosphate isomerase [Rhizomicrobium sp.]|nr:triose-phosphate isomerase [Rhizomicrobium sp.]
MRPLIAGNWKMNGLAASLAEIEAVCEAVVVQPPPADVLICPPATLIAQAVWQAKGRIAIGGQDCHPEISGAFTGDVSAQMLLDAGAAAVIVGHSERRQLHGETDALVMAKAQAAWRAGLLAIICIGESDAQRDGGDALKVCGAQLAGSVPSGATAENTAIAYEPIWAIGTGKTATARDIAEMHAYVRHCLTGRFGAAADAVRILYGGSVKPGNAREILAVPEVGGALVGGSSLKAAEFRAIFEAAPKR